MLVQLIRHLDSKGNKKSNKIYKNEMMIMREKTYEEKNWKYEKRIKFCEKMMMMGPE